MELHYTTGRTVSAFMDGLIIGLSLSILAVSALVGFGVLA